MSSPATPPSPQSAPHTVGNVSTPHKLAYGAGGLADVYMKQAVNPLAFPIYQIQLGVDPALLGTAIGVTRLWDALTDPLMGRISDNFRSRFGRRRPFIAAGAILSALSFIAIWWFPLGQGATYYFWHFLLGTLLFYSCYTLYGVSFSALGYGMSDNYKERTRIFAFSAFFGNIASMAVSWSFYFTQLPVFKNGIEGARMFGLLSAAGIVLFGLVPAIFLRERLHGSGPKKKGAGLFGFREMATVLKIKQLRIVMGLVVLFLLSAHMVNNLGTYILIYYVYDGDMTPASVLNGWKGTVQNIVALASVPLVTWLAGKLGKQRALLICLGCLLLGSLSKWFAYTPDYPYLVLLTVVLLSPGITAVFLICQSLLADICDVDELENGQRREGLVGAAYSWAMKLAISLGFFTTGFVLVMTGFSVSKGMKQDPGTLLSMRLLFSLVPAAAVCVAIWLVTRLKLDESDVQEIQRKLAERKTTAPAG